MRDLQPFRRPQLSIRGVLVVSDLGAGGVGHEVRRAQVVGVIEEHGAGRGLGGQPGGAAPDVLDGRAVGLLLVELAEVGRGARRRALAHAAAVPVVGEGRLGRATAGHRNQAVLGVVGEGLGALREHVPVGIVGHRQAVGPGRDRVGLGGVSIRLRHAILQRQVAERVIAVGPRPVGHGTDGLRQAVEGVVGERLDGGPAGVRQGGDVADRVERVVAEGSRQGSEETISQ